MILGAAELVAALRERRTIIADERGRLDQAAQMKRLQTVSEKIDELEAGLPRPVPAELSHFLERRSYDKALAFLEAQTQP